MHKNYVVLSHDHPEHVLRMVARLADGESTIWLHVDGSRSLDYWDRVVDHPAVRLVEPRIPCIWATWSIVAATLEVLRAMVSDGRPGFVMLLSGQSYPIRTSSEIDAHIRRHGRSILMEVASLPDLWPDNYGHRLDYLNLPLSDHAGDLALVKPWRKMNAREAVGWARRLVRELGWTKAASAFALLARRRPPVQHLVRGGSQWWGMPWDVVEDLLTFHTDHPEFEQFFRWSQAPDELFFQTLVSSMYGDSLASRLEPSPTYVDWTPGDWDLPRVLVASDVPGLMSLGPGILFARKFDVQRSAEALDMIDLQLDRPEPRGAA